MKLSLSMLLITLVGGCAAPMPAEDPSGWYESGAPLDVTEYVEYTGQAYDFPAGNEDTIARLKQLGLPADAYDIALAPDDRYAAGTTCDFAGNTNLPRVIEGRVTIHPRLYLKTDGCDRSSDEKYYGSYFLEDRTGGILVLGDSKVAHFDSGDWVKLLVRGTRKTYDLPMVYSHDVLEVVRGPEPIYFQTRTTAFTLADIGATWRVTGEVLTNPDTFGQFTLQGDGGVVFTATIDSELSRRGFTVEPGMRVQATGPLIYSYSTYSLILMRRGQVEILD